MTELQPIADRIIIEVLENEEKTLGGIVLPSSAHEKSPTQRARVVSVGQGTLLSNGVRIEPEVHIDDIVLFTKMAGLDIKVNNRPYKVITERDIIGIIHELS